MRLARRFTENKALAITLCWVAALAVTGATDVLLFLAPALLIAIPLLGGRYIGEELIVRLAARGPRPPRRATSSPAWPTPPAPESRHPRGTGLLAFSLAKRPPPALPLPPN
jgi:hypothetical protein